MLITSIDFETTGEPDKPDQHGPHAICEIGITDVRIALGAVLGADKPYSYLCNPGRPVSQEARAVHHIGPDELEHAEATVLYVERFRQMKPDYFCAHNAEFESAFFPDAGAPFICTYRVALRLWKDAPSHKLQVLRYWLSLDIDQAAGLPAHRAGPDSYVGAALMARILENPDAPSLEAMVQWSKEPPMLHRVTFGKYRGRFWDELPKDYLRWIVEKSDMGDDVKENARMRLATQ